MFLYYQNAEQYDPRHNPIFLLIMLQQRTAGYMALDLLRANGALPLTWNDTAELRRKTDSLMQQFYAERSAISKKLGGGFFIEELLDRNLRTDETEIMDRHAIPMEEKLELVRALDRQNRFMGLYIHYASQIFPLVRELSSKKQREIRLIEIACGSGGLAMTLAEEAAKQDLRLSVTASDIVPLYIEQGNNEAGRRRLPVQFRLLDACRLDESDSEQYDITLIAHSLHHFSPGDIAVMIAVSEARGSSAFIGIDGYRDLLLGIGMPLAAALQAIPAFAMDGLTSARKFYSEAELSLIAESAAGSGCHTIERSWPASVLTVRFDTAKTTPSKTASQRRTEQ